MNAVYRFSDDGDPEIVRVIRSVLPVFTASKRPERVGTCVLAKIDEYPFIVTAAHVLRDLKRVDDREIKRFDGQFTVGVGGRLFTLESAQFGTSVEDRADIGLIPIPSEVAAVFVEHGARFLDRETIDEIEKADGLDVVHMLTNTYFALGFPASKSQTRIQHGAGKIEVRTFSVRATLAPTKDYPAGLSYDEHLLLDFVPDEIVSSGRPHNPPNVHGLSGGGVFRLRVRQPETTKLVGILIEHGKAARVMVGTRLAVVATLARDVIARHPETFR